MKNFTSDSTSTGNILTSKIFVSAVFTAAGLVFVTAGCNTRPSTPTETWYGKPTRFIDVNSQNQAEGKAVITYAEARRRYYRALVALVNYYTTIGDVQKNQWAETELDNLKETQTFAWRGIEIPPAKETRSKQQISERMLVENVVDARAAYLDSLDKLAQMYEKNNEEFKAYVIHVTQQRFHPEETFMYLRSATLPPMDLVPCKVIPAANELYEKALSLYQQGAKIPALADYDKERQALEMFMKMIDDYPQSTRIAMAAYYIAEIYKEYFKEHYLAAQWYERAMAWDPRVAAPVRFQCAVQYDFNLGQRDKALSLYKAALKLEPYYPSHVRYCTQRIEELERELQGGQPVTTTPPPAAKEQ